MTKIDRRGRFRTKNPRFDGFAGRLIQLPDEVFPHIVLQTVAYGAAPGTANRSKHVSSENPGANILKAPRSEVVIDPRCAPVVLSIDASVSPVNEDYMASPICGHGGRDPFYEPYIGKVDVGTLRSDSLARPCEIIFGRACIFPFHHRKSVAILHATWRAHEMQLLRFGLLALPKFGLRAARIGDDCLQTIHLSRTVRII